MNQANLRPLESDVAECDDGRLLVDAPRDAEATVTQIADAAQPVKQKVAQLTCLQWLQHRFKEHEVPGVFPPRADDPITDEAEVAFSRALTIRSELVHLQPRLGMWKPTAAIVSVTLPSSSESDPLQLTPEFAPPNAVPVTAESNAAASTSRLTRRRKEVPLAPVPLRRCKRVRPEGSNMLESLNDQGDVEQVYGKLVYVPVAAAAAEVGVPKSVVQRWLADEQVAFIRPQANNSHRLVDLQDLRRYVDRKRSQSRSHDMRNSTTAANKRIRVGVLVYALVAPTTTATDQVQPPAAAVPDLWDSSSRTEQVSPSVVDQVRIIVEAMQLEQGKYAYNGDIADVEDWPNRPYFELMIDMILRRKVHTIVALTPQHLAPEHMFPLLQHLCNHHGVVIKCVNQSEPTTE